MLQQEGVSTANGSMLADKNQLQLEGGQFEPTDVSAFQRIHFESSVDYDYFQDTVMDEDGWKKALEKYEERTVK